MCQPPPFLFGLPPDPAREASPVAGKAIDMSACAAGLQEHRRQDRHTYLAGPSSLRNIHPVTLAEQTLTNSVLASPKSARTKTTIGSDPNRSNCRRTPPGRFTKTLYGSTGLIGTSG